MELIQKLGERIRFLRKEKSLSQEQLGELSTSYIPITSEPLNEGKRISL